MPRSGVRHDAARSSTSRHCSAHRALRLGQTGVARRGERGHHLAEHVVLDLTRREVADPHGAGPGVPRQVLEQDLRQPSSAVEPVHDLQVPRVTRDGALEPRAPLRRLLAEALLDECLERERGVAQPAVAVVPVALAAERLGQRRGDGRDDAPRGEVRQQTQDEQRPHHGLAVRPVVRAAARPQPPRDGGRVDAVRHGEP